MNLDEVLQLQVLKLKAMKSGFNNGRLVDMALDQGQEVASVRNMCAKVSHELYESLELVCQLLSMSKRQFIEAAVSDAIAKAEDLIERTGAMRQGEL